MCAHPAIDAGIRTPLMTRSSSDSTPPESDPPSTSAPTRWRSASCARSGAVVIAAAPATESGSEPAQVARVGVRRLTGACSRVDALRSDLG